MRMLFMIAILLCGAGPAAADILVVGNKGEDSVGFIDLAAGRMIHKRETGHGPHEVAISPDGRIAAIVAYGSGPRPGSSIDLFDVAKASFQKRIDLGSHSRPHGILWHPDGERLIVTTEGSGHLLVVDTGSGSIAAALATDAQGSHMVALSPDGSRAYVANLGSGSVSVIDIAAGRLVDSIEVGREAEGIALSPDGMRLWVTARAEDRVMVYDSASLDRLAVIPTGRMPIRVAISPDGRFAVTSNARDGSLSVIDTAGLRLDRTVAPGDAEGGDSVPVTLLFDPGGTVLYVALTNRARIARLSFPELELLDEIAAGAGSDGLGYSALDPAW